MCFDLFPLTLVVISVLNFKFGIGVEFPEMEKMGRFLFGIGAEEKMGRFLLGIGAEEKIGHFLLGI